MKRKISTAQIIIISLSTVIVALFGANTEIYATEHNYGQWYTIEEPTCTESGEEERACLDCAQTEKRRIEAIGHDFSNEWTTDVDPTCTKEGIKSHHCSRCDEKTDITGISELGHDYSNWYATKEPTCTESGEEERTCINCQQLETRTTEPIGHVFVTVESTTEGYIISYCDKCNETREMEIEESTMNSAIVNFGSLSLIFILLPLIIIIISVVGICLYLKHKRGKKEKSLTKVTIQSKRKLKAQEEAISEENVSSDNKTETADRKASKGNVATIIICVLFVLICLGVIVWSML